MNAIKLKVCHIITKLELGGAQRNTLYTVSHLDKQAFDTILISGKGGILDAEARALKDTRVYFAAHLFRKINPFLDILALIELWKILSKEKPLIVHTHSSKAGILGRWAAKLAGVKVIIHTYHGFGFHDFQNPIIRLLYVILERATAFVTDSLIVVANTDREKGLKRGIGTPDKYTLIRSGISARELMNTSVNKEAKRRELGLGPDSKIVTTVGPFKPQKNLSDFIRLARLVKDKNPGAEFLVIGDGRERGKLESLAVEQGINGAIRFLGWRKDVPELLAISDVFVMTSLWEGLPRAILEAMCLGLPVVANGVDGVNDVVINGSTGFLSRPLDPAQAAGFVVGLLADGKAARAMGEKGREFIGREFDIDEMVRQQEALYLDKTRNLN
jgi:glycosyltransferase involved in cell wall biosynthesis